MTFITMSNKELDRFEIIKRLLRKEIDGAEAANCLKLSTRQARRLKCKVRQSGARGLIHGNRGRKSNNRVPDKERQQIIDLLHQNYYDFGPTFAAEKLSEKHQFHRDPNTIKQIMIVEGLWKPKPKRTEQKHRAWRERRASYGELEQFDGSYEHWFEDRGPEACLLAATDDATGKITKAEFAIHEGVFPVFGFWSKYLIKNGKPRAIYLDKFSTYHMNQPLAKENPDTLTQFQRAMSELQIEVIPANSPQAKGRVERLFGTLQDRLIKELRLAKISDTEKANQFLEKIFIPKYNRRFAVAPRSETNLHQTLSVLEQKQLPGILARQDERTVQNDFTFSFKNQWYQLAPKQTVTVCKKDVVMIEERLDGSVSVKLRGKYLNYERLPERPKKAASKIPWVIQAGNDELRQKTYKPASNHPWRHSTIFIKN